MVKKASEKNRECENCPSAKTDDLGEFFYVGNRLRAFLKPENACLILIQGIEVCIEAKSNIFRFSGGKFMQGIDCAHSRIMKRFLDSDSENGVGVLT